METYYHYTTLEAARAIMQSGVIRKSTKKARGRDDALYGTGVYLTQIAPTKPKYVIAYNNYDGNWSAVSSVVALGWYCC